MIRFAPFAYMDTAMPDRFIAAFSIHHKPNLTSLLTTALGTGGLKVAPNSAAHVLSFVMNRHSLSLAFTAITLACTHPCSGANEVRPWTDKTSGKKIDASMVSADPKARTVTIQRADGQSFTLPVDRLVDADLAYIKAHLSDPAVPPAAPAPAPAAPAPGAPPAAPAPAAAKPASPAAPTGTPAPAHAPVVAVPAKKFKAPIGAEVMAKMKKVRPRIIMGAEGFLALRERVGTDPTSKALLANITKTVDDLMALPELSKVYGEVAAAGAPGREGLFRLSHLGALNFIKPDPRLPDRAVKEMLALSKDFPSWNPDKTDICAEFTWGIALGYDWFRSALNPDQAKIVRTALIKLGMEALAATVKGDPMPATAKRLEAAQTETAVVKTPPKPTAKKREDTNEPVSTDHMKAACALMMASIAIAEDDPTAATVGFNVSAKYFGRGIDQFAPDGIWAETLEKGDEVLDMAAAVINSLRVACGTDFGFSTIEGLPSAGVARIALAGPGGLFNYGDARAGALNRPWVTSWLAAMYGNPGVPALKVGPPVQPQKAGLLSQVGLLLYNSPYITGYGTPEALDHAFTGADVVTMRTAWNDSKAMFVGIKGGYNGQPRSQLDLGTFVLDANGVRWAIDLGGATDRSPGMEKDDSTKYKMYKEGSEGQNVLYFGENQPTGARANLAGFVTTPEKGVAIIDLVKASAGKTLAHKRGVMMVRGANPYVLMQDEFKVKASASPEWIMHTRAEVTPEGNKVTLKSGSAQLIMTVLSPKDVKITAAEPAEPKETTEVGSLKGIKAIKVSLGSVKGDQTVTVAFSTGEPVTAPVVPLEQWIGKKK